MNNDRVYSDGHSIHPEEFETFKNQLVTAWKDPEMGTDLRKLVEELLEEEYREKIPVADELENYMTALISGKPRPVLSPEAMLDMSINMEKIVYDFISKDDQMLDMYGAGCGLVFEIVHDLAVASQIDGADLEAMIADFENEDGSNNLI